ncbi:unnamed protein product [Effrenium voratum]|nr:unnamed protein product [Effrenium voratum]
MLHAVETVHGHLPERETPSSDYLSQKLEEIEQGELVASPLDELGNKEEALTMSIQSSVDSSGRLRVTRERKKSKLPANSEELRLKLKVECNTMLMLGSKFKTRTWFQNLTPSTFAKFGDFLLGEKVYALPVPSGHGEESRPLHPPWNILLKYEHAVRKEAYKLAVRENISMVQSFPRAMADSELKEVHFVSPVTLATARSGQQSNAAMGSPHFPGTHGQPWKYFKGGPSVKGKKGHGKGKLGRPDNKFGFLYSATPDGRPICYEFQKGDKSACKGCQRVHVCQICLKGGHGRDNCRFKPAARKGGGGAAPPTQQE